MPRCPGGVLLSPAPLHPPARSYCWRRSPSNPSSSPGFQLTLRGRMSNAEPEFGQARHKGSLALPGHHVWPPRGKRCSGPRWRTGRPGPGTRSSFGPRAPNTQANPTHSCASSVAKSAKVCDPILFGFYLPKDLSLLPILAGLQLFSSAPFQLG